jgi:hypothetical protein
MKQPRLALVLAAARFGVGIVLVTWPDRPLPPDERANGTSAFLMRTIGIRDLVLGGGALTAWLRNPDDFRRWAVAGAASDTADLVAGLTGTRLLGRSGATKSVAVVAPWVAAGVVALRRAPKP